MKKTKNVILLIGISCVLSALIWQVIMSFSSFPDIDGAEWLKIWAKAILLSSVGVLAFFVSVFLLICNLKNKTGKVLPIISIILNGAVLFYNIANLFVIPNIPQYLIVNDMGLLNLYLTQLLSFLKNGALLSTAGYVLLLVGSALSLSKKQRSAGAQSQS